MMHERAQPRTNLPAIFENVANRLALEKLENTSRRNAALAARLLLPGGQSSMWGTSLPPRQNQGRKDTTKHKLHSTGLFLTVWPAWTCEICSLPVRLQGAP